MNPFTKSFFNVVVVLFLTSSSILYLGSLINKNVEKQRILNARVTKDLRMLKDSINENDTTNNSKIHNESIIHYDSTIPKNSKIQNDTTIQNDITNKNDTVIQNDITNQNNTTIQNNITNKNDTVIQNDITNQNNTTVQNDITNKNDTVIQNDITNKNDTVIQNDITNKNDTTIQNDITFQNTTTVQNDITNQNNTTTVQNNITNHNDTTTLDDPKNEIKYKFFPDDDIFGLPDFEKYRNVSFSGKPYLKECINRFNERTKDKKIVEAVKGLSGYIAMEPLGEIDETCGPAPLPEVVCSNYKSAFGINPQPDNKKVGILIQFGFDVDLLEVYLHEVYDVIDKFFITESVVIHSTGQQMKPLMWEKIKYQKRFSRFADKIVHFIIDDSELKNKNEMWVSESNQERLRWEKFLAWNEENKFFDDNDIIGFGDADEIPSRKAINVLKHCSGNYVSIDIAAQFFYGTYDVIVRPDWPVPGHSYSFGDPSFFTVKSAKNFVHGNEFPSRRRGTSGKYIIGNMGAHLTYYPYTPFLLNKYVVCTECHPLIVNTTKSMEEIHEDVAHFSKKGHRWSPLDTVKNSIRNLYFIPWFLKCNPQRFPAFYNNPDPREYLTEEEVDFEC
ncbi:glycosyltransferase family 17 protein [Piromyces sp. E2]|nr:glycosyltransferase family 17 protein [Piromyces sp. E2]|eukprot:OUM70313.1 glycosyltransferase family 17 protein [Piromyces sp. E2]